MARNSDWKGEDVFVTRRFVLSMPIASMSYNTGSSAVENDGPVWQGRGGTVSLTGGIVIVQGWISLAIRPVAFASQNAAYSQFIVPSDTTVFNSQQVVGGIDLPYRFGAKPYARIDGGETSLRIGTRRYAIGAATSSQRWGPAHFFPLVMGTEAAGIPRVFAEAREFPTGFGRGSFLWMGGRLESTPYTGLLPGRRSRMVSSVAATFAPDVFPGMELGVARFFHVRWESGIARSTALLPFRGLLKNRNPTNETAARDLNQLGSVFVRIAPRGTGLEVYSEFYREDHNADVRDLSGEPDHASAFTIGIRKAWRGETDVSAVTIETTNGRFSHLARLRSQGPVYVHGGVPEGHTNLGQPLGNAATLGGGGPRAVFERIYTDRTFLIDGEVRHTAHNMEGGSWSERQTGLYGLRVGGREQRGSATFGLFAGIHKGFGFERGWTFSLNLEARR